MKNKKIEYLYSANGSKVNKKVTNGTTIAETDYLTGYQTERARFANTITAQRSEAEQISNSAQYLKPNAGVWDLQFFPTSEGYVDAVRVGTNIVFTYVYNYTDHLGNVRLSYAYDINNATIKIMEENNYYPFGLKMRGFNFSKTNINPPVQCPTCPPVFVLSQDTNYKYKYQGQERQDELGLNWDSFKWRNYDYAIGRFMSVDPLAEKYVYNGVYNFSENRVIDGRELEGLEWQSIKNDNGNQNYTFVGYDNNGKPLGNINATNGGFYGIGYTDSNGKAQGLQLMPNGTMRDQNTGTIYKNGQSVDLPDGSKATSYASIGRKALNFVTDKVMAPITETASIASQGLVLGFSESVEAIANGGEFDNETPWQPKIISFENGSIKLIDENDDYDEGDAASSAAKTTLTVLPILNTGSKVVNAVGDNVIKTTIKIGAKKIGEAINKEEDKKESN